MAPTHVTSKPEPRIAAEGGRPPMTAPPRGGSRHPSNFAQKKFAVNFEVWH